MNSDNVFYIPDTPHRKGLAYISHHILARETDRSHHFNSDYGRLLIDNVSDETPYFEVVGGAGKPIDIQTFMERFWELQRHPAIKRFVPYGHGVAVLARVADVDLRLTSFDTYYGERHDKYVDRLSPGDVVYLSTNSGANWLSIADAIDRF